MSDAIKVATDELRELGGELRTLSDDLKSTDGHADYNKNELAHSTVIDAMDNFKDNWNDNRDHLADKLKKLGDDGIKIADTFDETDEELAKQISKAMEESA